MSNFVSLLTPAGSAAAPNAARFPSPSRHAETSQTFSTALERAVHPATGRPDSSLKPGRSRANHSEVGPEPGVRSERRELSRSKDKRNPRDEEHSLAGACAVNGQPVKLEAPPQPSVKAAGDNAAEPGPTACVKSDGAASVAAGDDAQSSGTDAGVEGEATAVNTTLLKAPTSPVGELESLVQPMTATSELSQTNAPAAPLTPTNLETTTGLPEPSVAKVTSAIAAAIGTEVVSPTLDETAAANVLTTAAAAEVAKEIAPPSDEARRTARATRRSMAEASENDRGIGGAKSTEMMKTVIKREEIAGLSQQLLPGSSPIPVSAQTNLPGEARLGMPGGVSPADALNAMAKLSPSPTRADVSGTGEALDVRSSSALARVSEVISREVRMFKRSGDDLVEVVLTPDARTQISLRLQWREGQVEVQARCDLGDHHSLNQQWSQLQASMAQHGVRLSHLNERVPTGFTEFFSNPGFSQQQGGEHRASANANGAEQASPTVGPPGKAGATKSGGRSSRLLESWA